MALSAVSTGQNTTAAQLNQLINLLTGVMTDQQVTLRHASSNPLLLDRSDAAGIKGLAAIQRAAATKWWLGLDASDQMAILNAAGNAVNFGLTDLGAATIRAGLTLGGALSGATTGAFSGEVNAADFKSLGVASLGSAVVSRYVGAWSTFGAPTGLTALVSDWGIDGNQAIWICTVAGTPGTWITLPLGLLPGGYAQGTGTFSSLSGATLTDIAGLSCTVTVGTGRRIKVSGFAGFQSTVVDGQVALSIREGSTTLQAAEDAPNMANATITEPVEVFLQPSGGSHTYKLAMQRINGTGTVTPQAGTTAPAYISVEDVGV